MDEVNMKSLNAIDPATEEVFASLAMTDLAGVDATVKQARSSLDASLEWKNPGVRSTALFEMGRLLMENINELAMAETFVTGSR